MEETKKKSGFATTSLVLGIIGLCTSFIPFINNLSFILALIAIVFSIVALAKKASKGMAIAGIIISVLAMVITINSQKALSEGLDAVSKELDKATGASTEEILKNDVDIELGNFEVIKDSYGLTNTKLKTKVTNKTNETKSFSIQVEAVNADGSRITNDYIYANSLNAGQSQEFNLFEYVESEKLEMMKNATFKIVEASMY